MPEAIIPRLAQLASHSAGFEIPDEFVKGFVVDVHGGNWGRAERHWEYLVAKVLNTDAVDAHATRRRAIHQAGAATVRLLERTELSKKCPLCSRPRWWSRMWRR